MASTLTRSGQVFDTRFTLRLGAIDSAGVCEYFGYEPTSANIARLKAQPNFPEAIKPAGARGQERWNVEELDEYRLKYALRSSAGISKAKWSANDPRRIRANARAAVAAATKNGPAHPGMESVQ